MKIISKQYSKLQNDYEWRLEMQINSLINNTIVYIIHHRDYTNTHYYTTGLIINNQYNIHKSYGYSNYHNTSKYVIKGLLHDLHKLESGNFINKPHYFHPEKDLINLKKY